MCGIIGYLDKRGRREQPVGQVLLSMLQALSCRGPDSAGVAIFSPASDWHLRLSTDRVATSTVQSNSSGDWVPIWPPATDDQPSRLGGAHLDPVVTALHDLGVAPHRHYRNGVYDALLGASTDIANVEEEINRRLPGVEIICLGRSLDLYKQVGSPERLDRTYRIGKRTGTHGIGHTRLSTESRVDLSHSQPFWAHGVPDLATVHNGHITNYHRLRRQFEQRGYRFYTENDSEIIGVYLRDRLKAGLSIPDALRASMDAFDGSFSYLAAWSDGLAYVKDRFGFKPLMVAETDDFVAIATEEIALRQALGRDFVAKEPAPGTLHVWRSDVLQSAPMV